MLRIRDFALIEELSIEFGEGLNILTGETGAGKSIIINALGLVLGEKACPEDVRSDTARAVVEAVFETGRGELLIRREIAPSGRGKCFANEKMVLRSRLKEIGEGLVDIHGQHTHQSLLHLANHLDLLDGLGKLMPLRQEADQTFEEYLHLKRELGNLEEEFKERERKIDLLRFQIKEIEMAGLEIGEEERLLCERTLLRNAESLFHCSNEAYKVLDEDEPEVVSVRTGLGSILNSLRRLSQIDSKTKPFLDSVEEVLVTLEDTSFELRNYRDGIEFSEESLFAVEERLDTLARIKRKYGGGIEEAFARLDSLKHELSRMEHSQERIDELAAEIEEVAGRLIKKSLLLSGKRKKVAKRLEKGVEEELAHLGMKNTRFKVDIRKKEAGERVGEEDLMVDSKGCDEVEFLISPNPGERLKPLAKIASGGELSRIMLAMKGILAGVDEIPVLIFDEIDVGIGGATARVVGERLSSLSKSHQVICITHLPQIASLADIHFRVEKSTIEGRTTTLIKSLNQEERIFEIARMFGGEKVSETSLKQAREMLKRIDTQTQEES
ncbi:DNA repair protein RecN [bacterium]|nr:DNA repair protein RecN [bacterium]